MSKTPNTDLFELIQSLSKGEKRYFKIHASRHIIGDENKYVKLFDAICNQKVQDEKHLLKNESYIRQLPLLKKRLHGAVLKALDSYHNSIDANIRRQLHQAEILYEKALYEQAKKILKNAKKLSSEHELQNYLLEILRWETKIAWAQDSMDTIGKILEEEKNILLSLDNLINYRVLNHKAFSIYYKHGIPRTPDYVKEVKQLLSNPLLKNPKLALSFEAIHTYYHFMTIYHTMRQDYAGAHNFGIKKLELFNTSPQKIKSYTNLYLGDLNDILISSLMLKKYSSMEEYVGKLRELETIITSERNKTILFFYSYHELNYYVNTGQFQKAVKRVEQLEELFPLYERKMTTAKKAVLYTIFAVTYFGNKNFRKSIYYLNKIRNEPFHNVRTDIESLAQLIYLIVHYEKGSDIALMQSLVRSTYRFLLKRNRLYKFEECILNFIRKKLSKVNSAKELIHAFKELKKEIASMIKNPYNQSILQDFDFESWLESKIEGKSFAEIVRRKSIS